MVPQGTQRLVSKLSLDLIKAAVETDHHRDLEQGDCWEGEGDKGRSRGEISWDMSANQFPWSKGKKEQKSLCVLAKGTHVTESHGRAL